MRHRQQREDHGEDDGCGMEGFFRAALFEFSEISGSRGEGKARALGLDDDRCGKEDAHEDEGVEYEVDHVGGGKKCRIIS